MRAPAQYGTNLLALAVLLISGHHMPLGRTREIFTDLCGQAPWEGTLRTAIQRVDRQIDPALEAITKALLSALHLFVDETGSNVNGRQQWLHVASTAAATHYAMDAKRGAAATEKIGILPTYGGRLMPDFFAGYQGYDACAHSYCVAHLLRELQRMAERSRSGSHRWAAEFIDVLQRGIADHHRARAQGQPRVAASVMVYLGRRYELWINRGLLAFPASSGGANSDEYNVLRRLDQYRGDILCFLSDVRLEPTNNQAERDLRMMKLRQKISIGTALCTRAFLSLHRAQAGRELPDSYSLCSHRTALHPPPRYA